MIFLELLSSSCVCDSFNGENALIFVEKQLSFGYRIPGSNSSSQAADFIKAQLESFRWIVEVENFQYSGVELKNIIAVNHLGKPDIIIGTHYDTRQTSDQEKSPYNQIEPVPGANDGASGTALLIELSRHIKDHHKTIWLVFFDAEDQGNINNWPWSVGAEYFVSNLEEDPQVALVVDMIGDRDLNIFLEKNSDSRFSSQIWKTAKEMDFDQYFINEEKYTMIDDHIPFINKGIPSVLIIDFDYPFWHTREDTLDKVSSKSLEITGSVLLKWLNNY